MKRVLFFFMLIPLFTACNDNDPDYSLDKFVTDLVTIENPDQATTFFMRTDDSTRLWTAATNFRNYRPKDGQRIIANYTILSDKPESATYDHDVKLNDLYEVLTQGIFNVTAATQDSIGNDNVYIEDMWIGSHFLNVEFVYPGSHKMHFINLVSDTSKVYNDGKIHLEFRHNATDLLATSSSPITTIIGTLCFSAILILLFKLSFILKILESIPSSTKSLCISFAYST